MLSLNGAPARMDEGEAYTNLVEALKIAESAARQLAFMRQNEAQGSYWMVIGGQLGTLNDGVQKLMRSALKTRFRMA